MSATIRPYAAADLAACRDLWVALTERHRLIYEDPTIGGPDVGLSFDVHLTRAGPDNIWLAEVAGEIVGMTGLIVGDDEAEVEPVVVAEPHRSQGVGAQLIEAAVAKAKRLAVRRVTIGPVARNSRAIELFVRSGFRIIGHVQLFIELSRTDEAPPRRPERSPAEIAELADVLKRWS